jgi:NarL family two-component system sensor histidine kinase YdfH
MNNTSSPFQRYKQQRDKNGRSETFMEWPFFIILTFSFCFVYVQSVYSNPAVRQPAVLVPYTVLMIVHTALHWLSIRMKTWRQVAVYLVIQGVLAFTVVYMSGNLGPLLAVYMGLIGESIGLLREKPRWMYISVPVFLGMSMVNYILQTGWSNWYYWMLAMLPMTFFIGVYVTLYSRQSEARLQAQQLLAELEAANAQLRAYSAQVEDLTIANERARMARDLHDTLSQGLAGLILQLEAADAHLAGSRPEKAQSIVKQTMEQARATLADARRAIGGLRDGDSLELQDALAREVDRFTTATGLPCSLHADLSTPVPDPVRETLIRAAAEALTNIARHARASRVDLRVTVSDGNVSMTVADDGCGFDPGSIPAGHYGLLGIRERVRLLDGTFRLESAPQKGTILKIEIPAA